MIEIYNYLYIGGYGDLNNRAELLSKGITDIINLSETCNPYDEFNYYKIDIKDDDVDIRRYFNKTNKFICNAMIKNRKVLVCCFAGLSRSVTIILAFLIRKRRMSLEQAFMFLKNLKPRIQPNEYFMRQLLSYQQEI